MYYNDHDPPHFHARYGGDRAIIAIDGPAMLAGRLPPRALGLVLEWAAIHQSRLREDWDLARAQAPLNPVPPLE